MQDRLALHVVFSFFPFLPKPLDLLSGLAFRILFCHVSSLCASNFQFLFQTHLIWQRIQTLISKHRYISQMVELSKGLALVLSFCLASKSRVTDDCSSRGASLLCHVQNICHHLALFGLVVLYKKYITMKFHQSSSSRSRFPNQLKSLCPCAACCWPTAGQR